MREGRGRLPEPGRVAAEPVLAVVARHARHARHELPVPVNRVLAVTWNRRKTYLDM